MKDFDKKLAALNGKFMKSEADIQGLGERIDRLGGAKNKVDDSQTG